MLEQKFFLNKKSITTCVKGNINNAEQFSALRLFDEYNDIILRKIDAADVVYWTGQAFNICLKQTMMDAANCITPYNWSIIQGTSSPVPGFDFLTQEFLDFCNLNKINFLDSICL